MAKVGGGNAHQRALQRSKHRAAAKAKPTVPPPLPPPIIEYPKNKLKYSDRLAIALTCLAAIVGIMLAVTDKTPASLAVFSSLMFGLSIYPVLHFLKRLPYRIAGIAIAALIIVLFAWLQWPEPKLSLGFDYDPGSPFHSTAHVTLDSGPTIGKYQMVCQVNNIIYQGFIAQDSTEEVTRNGYKLQLSSGETVSNQCLNNYFRPDPICLDVSIYFYFRLDSILNFKEVVKRRFVATNADRFQWHGQPEVGPKDGDSYCGKTAGPRIIIEPMNF